MATRIKLVNKALADTALAAAKRPTYHHNVMLAHVIDAGEAGITAAELVAWMETNKAVLGEGQANWDKYAKPAHVAYFIQRWRGAVVATKPDGSVVVSAPRKPKAKKATEVKATEVVADAVSPEAEAAVEELIEAEA
jgi:hypothetical protein